MCVSNARYGNLHYVSDIIRQVREQEVLEENKHTPQCISVPLPDYDKSRHGVHLELCYEKFTSVLAPSRKQSNAENDRKAEDRLKRQKRDDSSR